jgi:SAM-dependent methyltransferase
MKSTNIRSIVGRFVPDYIVRMRKNLMWAQIRRQYGQLSVAEAFNSTYRSKLWGNDNEQEFFSGLGSLEGFARPYTDWLTVFIADHKIKSVVDLGCGDFSVGQGICSAVSVNYVGVDIVPDLVNYNQSRFGNDFISFACANIIEGQLPNGDLCLIRQVLQHLSNEQISRVLANCAKFPYLVVTEDVYKGPNMRPNLDIMHGPDNRLFRRSGVFLDREPFAMRVQKVLEIPCPETHSIIQTCLIERDRSASSEGATPPRGVGCEHERDPRRNS